jgi:hypothetical protein
MNKKEKEHMKVVGEFTRLLQKLGIEDEFRNGIHIDDLYEMNNVSSDVAWSVLENRLNELGFKEISGKWVKTETNE